MSSDDSSNNNTPPPASDSSDEEKKPSMPEISMPDINLSDLPSNVKQGIHQGVKASVSGINAALSQLQHTSEAIRKPVTTGMEHLEHTSTQVATEARIAYERRHEFGPYYVGGATVSVGALTAMRRGKVPGLVLGGLAGAATYIALYEPLVEAPSLPSLHMPKLEWPFKNLTGNLPKEDDSRSDKKE